MIPPRSQSAWVSVLTLTLFTALTGPAQAAQAKGPLADSSRLTEVTAVEGIREYRLPNGLQVLLSPDDSKPTTTVNVTYRVGSRHET